MSSYLITGTTRGLGLTLTRQLLEMPASQVGKVIVLNRREPTPPLQELINKYSGRLFPVTAAVADTESVNKAAEEVKSILGSQGLDVLVNNAGFQAFSENGVLGMTEEQLTSSLDINVTGPHRVIIAFLPLLRAGKEKKIINITSSMGSNGWAWFTKHAPSPAYKIAKAAMNMLNTQYAMYLQDEGFTCLLISPGWMRTDLGGPNADLDVEEGTLGTKNVILNATKAQNGKFLNIHVPGKEESFGRYDGKEVPY